MNPGVLWARLKGLMRRREFDTELQQEMAAHLELATEENLRRGLPPEEARRLAAVRFGSVASAKEGAWDEGGLPGLDSCLRDARYVVRGLLGEEQTGEDQCGEQPSHANRITVLGYL